MASNSSSRVTDEGAARRARAERKSEEPRQDPWEIEGYPPEPCDCNCKNPSQPTRSRCKDPPRAKPKNKDCCEQLIDLIRKLPGVDQRALKFRKPKTKPKVKLANLCCALPIKERIGPMLLLILRRFRDGVPAGNSYEAKLQGFLGGLSASHRAALEKALNAYDGFAAGARDCAFETRFDDWPRNKALDPGFFAKNIVGEMLALGRMHRFGDAVYDEKPIGIARPWEQAIPQPGEPGNYAKITAPWPWICAVSPSANKATDLITDWYRNESSCVPGNIPRGSINYFNHEFAYSCQTTVNPGGGPAIVNCSNTEPSTSAIGGFGFGECPGGADYRVFNKPLGKQVCLQIPPVDPGSEIGLRGLNFFSPNAQVRVRKVDAPGFGDIPLIPLSDWSPDTTTPAGTATCAVRDHAYFIMPDHVNDGLNDIPIPPGRYAVAIVVPNDVNFAPVGGGQPPKDFASNEVFIDLQPSPNIRYLIETNEAYCYEETDGLGSDEPWFRAVTAVIDLPHADTGGPIPFPLPNKIDIMNTDDVDSGEWISFPGATLFSDALGRRVFAAAVLGLEVDSESAAKDEINNFGDAFFDFFKNFLAFTGTNADVSVLGTAIKDSIEAGAISGWVWASGAVLAAILAGACLYAIWAPADEIALDAFVLTSRQLFDMTDSNPADVPAGDDFLRIKEIRMNVEPLGKQIDSSGTQATYSERRHYRSTAENSHYGFVYRYKRT